MFFFKFILPGYAELCFFNFCAGKREETTFEKFFRYLNECALFIGSYQKDLYVLKTMIVIKLDWYNHNHRAAEQSYKSEAAHAKKWLARKRLCKHKLRIHGGRGQY